MTRLQLLLDGSAVCTSSPLLADGIRRSYLPSKERDFISEQDIYKLHATETIQVQRPLSASTQIPSTRRVPSIYSFISRPPFRSNRQARRILVHEVTSMRRDAM